MTAARIRWPILLALTGWAALLGGCWLTVPPSRDAARAAHLLPSLFAGLPIAPQRWGTPPPLVETEAIESPSGGASLHLYRPPVGRHPALLISLGVDPAPPDDPRVTRLLDGIARAGLVAVLVQSNALDADLIAPEAPDLLVRAFQRISARPYVRDGRAGFLGFSVGGALVSVAAADPRIRDQVAVVEAFGGYFELEDVIAAVTTGELHDGDRQLPWTPDPLPRSVITTNLVAGVTDATQRESLKRALAGDTQARAALAAPAEAVFDLLSNTDPGRAASLFARLPQRQRAQLSAVSPGSVIDGLRAPVFLMHDRGDPLVPFVESRRYRDALQARGRTPYFSEFDIFQHVDPTRGGSPRIVARDGTRLFLHLDALLRRLG